MYVRHIRTVLFALVILCMSAASFAQIGIAITIAPPPLPVYEQPLCPGEGYLWTPGYWAYNYDIDDYYWVPGTWVEAPEVGYLWTPAYWGWGGDRFVFYDGYWGPHVGFYGGISYGFGYFGDGYEGGRWDHDHFFYNRSVNNVNVTVIHNVYNTTIINRTENRVSYNGGNGGIDRRPRPQEEEAARDRHIGPVAAQAQHVQEARRDPQQRASVNMGKPAIAGTPRPGDFKARDIAPARAAGGNYTPPARRGGNQPQGNAPAMRPENNNNASRPNTFSHVRDLPPASKPTPPNSGNAKHDQKYQQQQEKQFAKQDQERQKLQQKQEQDHQRMTQQNANAARQQQVEQRHQQQTQQLQQKHEQQQQHLQQRQPQPQQNRDRSKPPR